VLAATLLAAALRAFHLGAQSLWIDEAFTWFGAEVRAPLRLAAILESVHGPLYILILHAWGALAGDAEWALRAPSLFFGVATVPALAWLARRWLGRDAAAPAAWLAAGSPFLVWYSQEARNYMLLILCTCLAGVALLGSGRRPFVRALGYLIAAGAGLLSSFAFALLAPLHLRWWLMEDLGRDRDSGGRGGRAGTAGPARVLGPVIVGAVLFLLLLPWMPQVLRTWDWRRLDPRPAAHVDAAPLRGSTTYHAGAIPFALHALAVGYTLGPSLRELKSGPAGAAVARHLPEVAAVTLVFGWLGLAGLAQLARRRRLLDGLLWFGVPVLVISFFALRNFKTFNPRYLAVSAPLVLLVMAAGLAGLRRPLRSAAGLAVGLLWTMALARHYFDPRYGKEDYRGAVRLVAERSLPGEKLLAVGAQEPIYYYYRGPLPVDQLWLGSASRPVRLASELDGKLAGARATWIVLSRPEDLDPRDVFARMVKARHPGAEEFRFEGVRVWHVKPGSAAAGASP
jgi:4-amino-4-deoxy-L-arabinose transferase-like glycosyltransferase